MPNNKSVTQCLTPMAVISVKCGDIIKVNHIFGPLLDIVHNNKLHHWTPEMKLNQKNVFIFKILHLENGPFLT